MLYEVITFFKSYMILALAALHGGDATAARAAYERMAETGDRGQSLATIGLWWNSNTISHNFIHRPFFRNNFV